MIEFENRVHTLIIRDCPFRNHHAVRTFERKIYVWTFFTFVSTFATLNERIINIL